MTGTISDHVHLRSYISDDFEALYEMDQACYPPGIAYSRRTLRWFLRLRGSECLVACAGNQSAIAAFILAEHKGSEGHIITLDVLSAHRRRGIGSTLLAAIEERLASQGVRQVELETATDNEPAVAFWHKCGYRTVARLPGYYLGRIDAFMMIKSLEAPRSAQEAQAAPNPVRSKSTSQET